MVASPTSISRDKGQKTSGFVRIKRHSNGNSLRLKVHHRKLEQTNGRRNKLELSNRRFRALPLFYVAFSAAERALNPCYPFRFEQNQLT